MKKTTKMPKDYKNFIQEAEDASKKSIWDYKYEYFGTNVTGDLIKDHSACILYGEDRKGYEKYKKEHPKLYITYSGEISLRNIKNSKTNETVGYITEEKVNNPEHLETAKNAYEKQFKEVIRFLGIKDVKNFQYYLNSICTDWEFTTSIQQYIRGIDCLNNIVNDYLEDEDYKSYLDKIIHFNVT